jgi:hypothetical protein
MTTLADTITDDAAAAAAATALVAAKKAAARGIDIHEIITASTQALDLSLKIQKEERLAAEKAQRFVRFIRQRVTAFAKDETVTVLSYISRKFAEIQPSEDRERVIELFNQRLERLCLCIDSDEKPVDRPAVLEHIDTFFWRNGIDKITETFATRHDCDMPLVHLYTMLLASCKMTQELKPFVSALVNILIDLPKYLEKHESLEIAHETTTAREKRAGRGRLDYSRLTAEQLTQWCIENDCEHKLPAFQREWRAFHNVATDADKAHRETAVQVEKGDESGDSDDDDDDDGDDDDEEGGGGDDDDDENDFDEDVIETVDDMLANADSDAIREALETIKIAEAVTMEKFTELFAKMIASDDLYRMDVQKKAQEILAAKKKAAAPTTAGTKPAPKRKASDDGGAAVGKEAKQATATSPGTEIEVN